MNLFDKTIRRLFGSRRGTLNFLKFAIAQIFFRRYSKYGVLPSKIERVVFVCKGNICRSALAEAVFKKEVSRSVASFGLDTTTGCPAHPPMMKVAKTLGYDLDEHVTTNVTSFVAQDNDVYVCTEPSHIKQLEKSLPHCNVVLLGLWGSPKRVYIHDPYSADEPYVLYISEFLRNATQMFVKEIENSSETSTLK
jgi:protein-tyrosine phosphatase